jgi:hypothetical protein
LFGHLLSSFKTGKIVLEDFSEVDTTKSVLVVITETLSIVNQDKEDNDASVRTELTKASKERAAAAVQGYREVEFKEMKDFASIDLRFAVGPLNIEV